ncbi:hypothetical protein QOT17_006171 [Balamuthia mandrillaris]
MQYIPIKIPADLIKLTKLVASQQVDLRNCSHARAMGHQMELAEIGKFTGPITDEIKGVRSDAAARHRHGLQDEPTKAIDEDKIPKSVDYEDDRIKNIYDVDEDGNLVLVYGPGSSKAGPSSKAGTSSEAGSSSKASTPSKSKGKDKVVESPLPVTPELPKFAPRPSGAAQPLTPQKPDEPFMPSMRSYGKQVDLFAKGSPGSHLSKPLNAIPVDYFMRNVKWEIKADGKKLVQMEEGGKRYNLEVNVNAREDQLQQLKELP